MLKLFSTFNTKFLFFLKINNCYINFFSFLLFNNSLILNNNFPENFLHFYRNIWFKKFILKNYTQPLNRGNWPHYFYFAFKNYNYSLKINSLVIKNNKNLIFKNYISFSSIIFNFRPLFYLIYIFKTTFLFNLYFSPIFFSFINNFNSFNLNWKKKIINNFFTNTAIRLITNKNLLTFNFNLI